MSENKYITVIQNDLLENTETLVYKGLANIENNEVYTIKYDENEETSVTIRIHPEEAFLERSGEVETKIHFKKNVKTQASVITNVGQLRMDVKTDEITLKNNNLMLGYSLIQDNNIISRFNMKVKWDNE